MSAIRRLNMKNFEEAKLEMIRIADVIITSGTQNTGTGSGDDTSGD